MATRICKACCGKGRVEVTGVYGETLALLRKQRTEVTGADLAVIASCEPTAMNNRLSVLESHGLATSRRYGRKRLFKVV